MYRFISADRVRDRATGLKALVLNHDEQDPGLVLCAFLEGPDKGWGCTSLIPAENLEILEYSARCEPGTCRMCDAMEPGVEPTIGRLGPPAWRLR